MKFRGVLNFGSIERYKQSLLFCFFDISKKHCVKYEVIIQLTTVPDCEYVGGYRSASSLSWLASGPSGPAKMPHFA